jgi:chemotaxis protein MotA
MNRFSFSTLVGITAAISLFIYAIVSSTNNYLMFISLSSFALVAGSTFAASLISYTTMDVLTAVKALFETLFHAPTSSKYLRGHVERFVEWGQVYRQQGIAGLESSLTEKERKDPFIAHGMELLSSGYKNHDVRTILTDDMDAFWQRMTLESKVLNTMAVYAPGFGMVGTIIGLVIMLDNMNGDMAALGKGLALALITTLYGVVLANLIFKPAANQVTEKQESLYFRDQIIVEGFVLLAEKRDSLFMQDRLNAYLKPSARFQPLEEEL